MRFWRDISGECPPSGARFHRAPTSLSREKSETAVLLLT